MKHFLKFGGYLLWFLQSLVVVLWIFEEKFVVPIQGLGHFHPLLLHLPIGFGIVLGILWLVRKEISSFDSLFQFVLLLTAIFSSITVLFGQLLAREGGYELEALEQHERFGILVSFIYFGWANWSKYRVWAVWSGVFALVLAGHTGARITHGEDLLTFGKEEKVISDESIVFEDLVQPILKSKCESCHNDAKSKGGLRMNSIANLMKGGKNGPLWRAGDLLNSHIIQRISLPLNAKKHMPPAGKSQLTADEQLILSLWIKEGASFKKPLKEFSAEMKKVAQKEQSVNQETKTYTFSAASEKDIESVNTPFCTVYPIAFDSPALQANFYVSAKFDLQTLKNLSKVQDQLVGLTLNKMPISDKDLDLISGFSNLEKLQLSGSKLNGSGLMGLVGLSNLAEISLSSTQVGFAAVKTFLSKAKSIKRIYLWNTGITTAEMGQLKKVYPKVQIEEGYVPGNEMMKINPPILVNENLMLRPGEDLRFRHTLQGVTFRYTLNDSLPDSLGSLKTTGKIALQKYGKVRILATKEGWYASNSVDYKVYKSNFIPSTIELLSTPDPKYPAHGANSLIDFVAGAREVKGVTNLTWLGFRETDFDVLAGFKKAEVINGITFSYLEKTDSDVFPPVRIEVWAGMSKDQLKKIASVQPEQPKEKSGYNQKGINIPIPKVQAMFYRIKAERVKRLPKFVENKGKSGWLRVDELLFY